MTIGDSNSRHCPTSGLRGRGTSHIILFCSNVGCLPHCGCRYAESCCMAARIAICRHTRNSSGPHLPTNDRRLFVDGRPILGPAKTIRGIVASVVATSICASLMDLGWETVGRSFCDRRSFAVAVRMLTFKALLQAL